MSSRGAAANDPPRREGPVKEAPPAPGAYRQLAARVVDLHPLTITQNARTSGGGNVAGVPTQAISVGPAETWKAEKVSIWHAGTHDNPFGMRSAQDKSRPRRGGGPPDSAPSPKRLWCVGDHRNAGAVAWRCTIGNIAVNKS